MLQVVLHRKRHNISSSFARSCLLKSISDFLFSDTKYNLVRRPRFRSITNPSVTMNWNTIPQCCQLLTSAHCCRLRFYANPAMPCLSKTRFPKCLFFHRKIQVASHGMADPATTTSSLGQPDGSDHMNGPTMESFEIALLYRMAAAARTEADGFRRHMRSTAADQQDPALH